VVGLNGHSLDARLGRLEMLGDDAALWSEARRIAELIGGDPAALIAEARRIAAAFGSDPGDQIRGVADELGIDDEELRRDLEDSWPS
jgi:hypothetical protein